jgi:hypothetical protein
MVKRIQLHFEDKDPVDEDCVVGDEDEAPDGMDHGDDTDVEGMDSLNHNSFVLLSYLDVHERDDWGEALQQVQTVLVLHLEHWAFA